MSLAQSRIDHDEAGQKNEVVMCLNSPTLPFLPCFITFCSAHSYTSYFYEIFATCSTINDVTTLQ